MSHTSLHGLSRWLGPFFLCWLAACGGDTGNNVKSSSTAGTRAPDARAVPRGDTREKPATYESELAALDAGIEKGIRLSAQQTTDGLLPVEVVKLYMERARLTGSYDDYTRAEAALAAAEKRAGLSAGVCFARASLHFTLHRLQQASATLDACPGSAGRPEIAAMRADISFYSGRYPEAEKTYRALVNQIGTPQDYVRLALFRNKSAAPGEAAAFLEAAEKRYHGQSATMKAWLKLQRGLIALDRGRLDEALANYTAAAEALPGWWLVEEHIAEVKKVSGDIQGAGSLYRKVIEKTGAPEYMDALAAIEMEQGREESARAWIAKARQLYDERLAKFPEAAAGHALSHFLQDPTAAEKALALAQANYRSRPYGDAAIMLARAWLLNGKPERAQPLLEAQLAAGWDSAELYWVLSQVFGALKQPQRAEQARAEASRRNPESSRMYAISAFAS